MDNQDTKPEEPQIPEAAEVVKEELKAVLDSFSEPKVDGGNKPKSSRKVKELVRKSSPKKARNGQYFALYTDGFELVKIYRSNPEELKEKMTER